MMRELVKRCVILLLSDIDPYDMEKDLKEEFNADDEEFDQAVGIAEDLTDSVNDVLDTLIDVAIRFHGVW